MSDACGCAAPTPHSESDDHAPWWRDRAILIPAASGVTLLVGLILEWFVAGSDLVALVLFWASLLLGASQFVPGALRGLFRSGRLGIGLLMTISAAGAVILGFIEEAAALAFLYSIVEALEDRAMDKARSGLRTLLDLIPSTATVVVNDIAHTMPVESLMPGQRLRLAAGERLATDGVVRSGTSSLDVSAITGESIPIAVAAGDEVFAGSINTSGTLDIETTAAGTDNSLTTVVELVEQAQHDKGQRARIADRLARPLVPGVLILALLVAVIGSLAGDPSVWIERALVVLVAASPCALAISVPVTVVSGIGAASKFGVVFKSGAAFERFGDIRQVAWDKTGTLTRNQPTVAEVVTTNDTTQADVLKWAAALEAHSTHPLAAAITAAASHTPAAHQVQETAGHGMIGLVEEARIAVGSPRWLTPGPLARQVRQLEGQGMTVVMVHRNDEPIGAIGVRDELRPEVPAVIQALADTEVTSTMLTGDNSRTAEVLATAAGIDQVHAELRPDGKAQAVTAMREQYVVAMIGDGINDAPALASADLGIAMGATGSDAAIESADIAFTGDDLRLIPRALDHARRGRSIINQNIILSLAIIVVLLPLAITGVLGLATVVLVHELAEVIVILNGLRAGRTPTTPTQQRQHQVRNKNTAIQA